MLVPHARGVRLALAREPHPRPRTLRHQWQSIEPTVAPAARRARRRRAHTLTERVRRRRGTRTMQRHVVARCAHADSAWKCTGACALQPPPFRVGAGSSAHAAHAVFLRPARACVRRCFCRPCKRCARACVTVTDGGSADIESLGYARSAINQHVNYCYSQTCYLMTARARCTTVATCTVLVPPFALATTLRLHRNSSG